MFCYWLYFQLFLCVFCIQITSSISIASTQTQKILILNASHKGDDMSDSILNGIESALYPKYSNIQTYIEYMDINRHSKQDSFVLLAELYARRYKNTKFNGILACDDLALKFVLENRTSLFPKVPVVFCGVEKIQVKKKIPSDITGIIETYDLLNTIDIAQKLHPLAKKIVVICDKTITGKKRLARLKRNIKKNEKKIQLIEIIPDTISDLSKNIKTIPENSIVLFLHFSQDNNKNQYTPSKIINIISSDLKAPLYTSWFYPKANGVLGGKMVNGLRQGKLAANMIIQILKGKPVQTIPILKNSPNSYIFNYQEMNRFNIRLSDLPGGSIITHKPKTFFYKYRKTIAYLILAFLFLFFSVFLLLANISKRKKAEKKLELQIRVLETFMETIPNPIFFKDEKNHFSQCNVAFQALIGMDDSEIIGKTFYDITTEELAKLYEEKENMLIEEPGFQSFETPFQRSNGEVFTVIINHATITDKNGKPTGLIGSIQDITDLKS